MAAITEGLLRDILHAVGGADNIEQCGNCMTRLRLTLVDAARVDSAKLKTLPGVLEVIESDVQLQIVLGPGKAQTAAEKIQMLLNEETPADLHSIATAQKQQMKAKQTSALHRFLSCFATILPR